MGDHDDRITLSGLPRSEVVFNYLGQFDNSFDDGELWQLAEESMGVSLDERTLMVYPLSLNGQVYQGELQFSWSFSSAYYQTATIQNVIDFYQEELESLIEHCCNRVSGITSSDVPEGVGSAFCSPLNNCLPVIAAVVVCCFILG